MRVAAIDCGTNSIRLLIADVDDGHLTDVVRTMVIVRLGQGVDRTGQFAQLSTDTSANLAPWATLDLRRKISFISDRLGNYMWGPGKQFYFASYYLKDGK